MSSTKPPKFDFNVNPVYQIDWCHEATGKLIAASKRRVKFRFGFSNREAIEQGMTGPDCRGEEHEVVLIWSLASGKRFVSADGREIHYSSGKMTDSMFETSWSTEGCHIIKIIAHAAPPLVNKPGFRQFDLLIDGLSFFDMPKIYELGTRRGNRVSCAPMSPNHFALPSVTDGRYDSERDDYSESNFRSNRSAPVSVTPEFATGRAQIKQLNSTPESPKSTPEFTVQQHQPPYVPPESSTFQTTQAPPTEAYAQAPIYTQAPPAPVYSPAPQTLTQTDSSWWTQGPPTHDEFAPVAPPPPSFADKSKQILSAYTPSASSSSPAVMALMNTPYYSDYDSATPGATASDVSDSEEDSRSSPVLKLTMKPISIDEKFNEDERVPKSEVDRAMEALVNLEDLTRPLEAPEQVKTVRRVEEKKMSNKVKSTPLPANIPKWQIGANPCLSDIKQHSSPRQPAKEVMRTHAFDPNAVHAGMMVMYGSTSMNADLAYARNYPVQYGHSMPPSHPGPYALRTY